MAVPAALRQLQAARDKDAAETAAPHSRGANTAPGTAMPRDIMKGFLCDPIQAQRHCRIDDQWQFVVVRRKDDRHLPLLGELTAQHP